jgi:hypothetical protein
MTLKLVKELNETKLENVKIIKITDKIFQIDLETQSELCVTFLRFQEFYESPEFKGKTFTLDEFADWYAKDTGKPFDYHTTWNGFNVPSGSIKEFLVKNRDLSIREESFLDLFKDIKGDFYVIGTHSEKCEDNYADVLKHETGHGLYSTNPSYREKVNEILKDVDSEAFSKLLSKLGYNESVHLDETHAYLLADSEYLKEEGLDIEKFSKEIDELNKLYIETLKEVNPVLAVEEYIRNECKKAGVKIVLSDGELIDGSDSVAVPGFFNGEKNELYAARGNKRYLPILVHEFNHAVQKMENCSAWTNCYVNEIDMAVLFDLWLEKKIELNVEQLREYTQRIIECEKDCEERTAKMIKEFNLPIKDYEKKANSYILMYHVVEGLREWCTTSPRDNEKVMGLMSDKFDMDYETISDELISAYNDTFS